MSQTVRPVVRNRGEILLVRGEAGWDTVSGPAGTDPERAARRLLARTGLPTGDLDLVRAGDLTPPGVVDAVVTERGPLDIGAVEEVAAEHRALRGWQQDEP